MIIVEGPDGGGKSTLVKHLVKSFSLELPEHSRLSDDERNDPSFREPDAVRKRVYTALLRCVTGRGPLEVHDRLFFSEMVYSHIMNRPCCFPFYEERHIGRLLNALEVPVIFCIPPYQAISKRYLSTQQMDGVPENYEKIYNQYVQMAGFMGHSNDRTTFRNKHGKAKRMPAREYNLPPVIIYNYTKAKSLPRVEQAVSQYIGKRQKRTVRWQSN